MKKVNKEMLRLALEEYREACYRMQAESERCREIELRFVFIRMDGCV